MEHQQYLDALNALLLDNDKLVAETPDADLQAIVDMRKTAFDHLKGVAQRAAKERKLNLIIGDQSGLPKKRYAPGNVVNKAPQRKKSKAKTPAMKMAELLGCTVEEAQKMIDDKRKGSK